MMNHPQGSERFKRPATNSPSLELWYDVQDENGVWRVGFCQKNQSNFKVIALDGFHPIHTSHYCEHSGKILPIRSKTIGLTTPEDKTIRRAVKLNEIERVCGKLNLFHLLSSLLQENTPEKIRVFIRTELLIFIDTIFNTPFETLTIIKMLDVHINKLFMYSIQYYFKLLENSKRFMHLIDTNLSAQQLFKATYEMAIVIGMILGVHKRSKNFYDSPLNTTIRCEGIVDYFIKYEGGGILPFKLFFKNLSMIKSLDKQRLVICLETVYLFISLCEKYPNDLIEGKVQSTTRLIIEEIISLIKVFSQKSKEIATEIKTKMELVSRIQTLYFKLFPNRPCDLRKFIEGQKQAQTSNRLKDIQTLKSMTRMRSDLNLSTFRREMKAEQTKSKEKESEKITELQSKIEKLQMTLSKLQIVNMHHQNLVISKQNMPELPLQPTQNLGQEAFLGSLEWALQAGDTLTCKKLIQWRRSLLKLGRITGWEIALAVGMKTFKKKEISAEDIIQANYQFINRKEGH